MAFTRVLKKLSTKFLLDFLNKNCSLLTLLTLKKFTNPNDQNFGWGVPYFSVAIANKIISKMKNENNLSLFACLWVLFFLFFCLVLFFWIYKMFQIFVII